MRAALEEVKYPDMTTDRTDMELTWPIGMGHMGEGGVNAMSDHSLRRLAHIFLPRGNGSLEGQEDHGERKSARPPVCNERGEEPIPDQNRTTACNK